MLRLGTSRVILSENTIKQSPTAAVTYDQRNMTFTITDSLPNTIAEDGREIDVGEYRCSRSCNDTFGLRFMTRSLRHRLLVYIDLD